MIRNAVYEDKEEIYRLTNLLEDTILNHDSFMKIFDECFEKDLIYVYEMDQRIIAFIHTRFTSQFARASCIAEIQELIVEEGYRNKGIGKALLDKTVDYCREKQIGIIEVLSSTFRKDAHRFYENNGFDKTGYRFFNKEWKDGIKHE